MSSPYAVSLASLTPSPKAAVKAEGPSEPTGSIPNPVEPAPTGGTGPMDPALPVNAVAVHGS